jgi:hypothetical protein
MAAKKSYLETGRQFYSLTLKDLIEARDAYHVFLARKKNVIGTAIGKYRRRPKGASPNEPKTLENTKIDKYSRPCVMVFVDKWITEGQFGKKFSNLSEDYIPRSLFLPDGREIPVCVIMAKWQGRNLETTINMKMPGSIAGGGYPITTVIQGKDRMATLGCLVTDGRLIYGLTNAHVTGKPGEHFTITREGHGAGDGAVIISGVSSEKQLHKVPFTSFYENYPGKHVLLNLDIGLIEFDDINNVSSQIYSIGEVTGIEDINHDTLSLNLVGCPVKGFGAVSGLMYGEITGLFYRYVAAGGYDYVADYLVTPRRDDTTNAPLPFAPAHGDSGTLFVIDDKDTDENMKAIGVLWGGQQDNSGGGTLPAGLVTNLGTICQQLDVELIGNWNTGYDRYFGAYAHIILPSLCAGIIKNKSLKTLMGNNAQFISLPLGETDIKETKGLSNAGFVPLSDVADLVWKKRGGRYNRTYEGANHFADMDQKNSAGKTLLDLCETTANIEPGVWLKFYKDVHAREKGDLPFRVAQIFDAMVDAAQKGDAAKFIGGAGIVSHYIFDACMPLHISYLHHGDPEGEMKDVKQGGKTKQVAIAYGVHDEFDNAMVEYHAAAVKERLPGLVSQKAAAKDADAALRIKTAREAAVSTVKLMKTTFKNSNPREIVDEFTKLIDNTKRDRSDELWVKYGDGMLDTIAEGVLFTARLWEAAWLKGNGDKNITNTKAVGQEKLKVLYETKDGFLPSVKLEDITKTMNWT